MLLLFVWQITFLCVGYQINPSVKNQIAAIIEDIQEEEEGFESADEINDGFNFSEILEEEIKLCPNSESVYVNSNRNSINISCFPTGLPYLNVHFSPPEI